ncbi:hypothetical protein [Rhodovulum sulfidophilum]|uniref:hypothetical protein n=1 Tax=Rhodovulum sulfidophilum TaxID=35806 RepID=UPI00117A341D|nr:hypothetical protein [Rhodovulum sulfidophilum]MBL3552511.1 hypothetical protein [Rhodovulum sulfidophilum]
MSAKTRQDFSAVAVIGMDIGKDVIHLVGFSSDDSLVLRQKIKRLCNNTEINSPLPHIRGWHSCRVIASPFQLLRSRASRSGSRGLSSLQLFTRNRQEGKS